MLPGVLDAAVTPRCAYYTSKVIRNFIHEDDGRLSSGHARYGKCEINLYIVYDVTSAAIVTAVTTNILLFLLM
jgi:hypothetical protein